MPAADDRRGGCERRSPAGGLDRSGAPAADARPRSRSVVFAARPGGRHQRGDLAAVSRVGAPSPARAAYPIARSTAASSRSHARSGPVRGDHTTTGAPAVPERRTSERAEARAPPAVTVLGQPSGVGSARDLRHDVARGGERARAGARRRQRAEPLDDALTRQPIVERRRMGVEEQDRRPGARRRPAARDRPPDAGSPQASATGSPCAGSATSSTSLSTARALARAVR